MINIHIKYSIDRINRLIKNVTRFPSILTGDLFYIINLLYKEKESGTIMKSECN